MKQLRLFFPFVFPLYIDIGDGGRSDSEWKGQMIEKHLLLQKQMEALTARVNALEAANKAREENFAYVGSTSS